MKRFVIFFLLLICHYLRINAQSNIAEVKRCYQAYKDAVLNGKGEEAVKYVDAKSIAYYGTLINMIKNGDSNTVSNLPVMDKLTIFSMRERATKAEIMPLDGKGLLIFSVNKGFIAKSNIANNELGDVTIDSGIAKGKLIVKGESTPYYFFFSYENGLWKLDLTALLPIGSNAMAAMITNSHMEENEFLLLIIEKIAGKKPGREIWKKVNQ